MRPSFLLGIGLLAGLVLGFMLARQFAAPPGPPVRETLSGPQRSLPSAAEIAEESAEERRFAVDSPDLGGEGLGDGDRAADLGQADLLPAFVWLDYEDREGRALTSGIGLVVDVEARLALVPLADLRGAAFAIATTAGRSGRVLRLHGLREDLGLALLELESCAQAVMIAPQTVDSGAVLEGIEARGSRRRYEVSRRRFDEQLLVEVLDVEPPLPDRALYLFDAADRALGFSVDSSEGRCVLPVAGLDLAQFSTLDLSLVDYDRRFYFGSTEDLIAQARLAFREGRFSEAVTFWHRVLELEPFRRAELTPELERAWRALLVESGLDPRDRLALLRRALVDLPELGDFWFEAGGLLRSRLSFAEAIAAFENAATYAPELVPDLLGLKGEIWYEQAQGLVQSGRIEEARELVYAALAQVPGHVDLWLLQAKLAERRRDYALAAESWRRAQSLDSSLIADLADAIALAESLTEAPGRLVIDYDPRQRSITVQVAINDRATGEFVIDTGATVSMVPDGVARAAGLDLSDRAPKIRLETAGSSRILPYTPSGSLQVGGLRVEGLSVVVGNLSGGQTQGLLGMDFLQKFHLTNDTKNGRLVLSER